MKVLNSLHCGAQAYFCDLVAVIYIFARFLEKPENAILMAAACMASDFLWRTVAAESSWWLPEQIRLSTYKVGPAMFNQVLFEFFCVNSILDCFYSMRTTQGVCAHQLDVTYKFCRLAVCSFGSFKNLM